MANDYGVCILVYMIFDEKFFNSKDMMIRRSTIPARLFEKDFYERMRKVLFIKSRINSCKWENFLNTCFNQMLTSHEMYVTFVMFACFREDECHQNKLESFLSVCSLVKLLSDEAFHKSGINFRDLNPDIFLTFYDYHLKEGFNNHGGFRRLVEYIHGHKFLAWIENWGDLVSSDGRAMDYYISSHHPTQMELDKKLKKGYKRERRFEKKINPDEAVRNTISIDFAKKVLSSTQVTLPSLPSQPDLVKSMIDYSINKQDKYSDGKRRTEVAENLVAMEEDFKVLSVSGSITDCDVKHQDDIKRHEDVIEAIIRYNNAKSLNNKSINSEIQEEAEVLEHLKDKIKSLIEVLDKYDKE